MKNSPGKSPSFQFYVKDWLSDPDLQKTHPTTRGVWINLLCYMWDEKNRGEIATNKRELCHLGSCLPEDVEIFLLDAKRLNFCEIFCDIECDGHAPVTLKNRRMVRDDKNRRNARKRKELQRLKNAKNGADKQGVTPNSQDCHTYTPTPSPSPSPTAKIKTTASPPHFSKKMGANFEGIKSNCEKINSLCLAKKIRFNAFMFVQKMANGNKHPAAINDALNGILKNFNNIDTNKFYGYGKRIIDIKSGNYNADEHVIAAAEFKKEWNSPKFAELTKGIKEL